MRAAGMFGAVALHGGSLVTVDHKGISAVAAGTHHVEFPVTAVTAVALTELTAAENGRLDLTVRTTNEDACYDPHSPNPFSMTFQAKNLDDFRAVAKAIDAARPMEPVAVEPPKPERGTNDQNACLQPTGIDGRNPEKTDRGWCLTHPTRKGRPGWKNENNNRNHALYVRYTLSALLPKRLRHLTHNFVLTR